MGCPPQGLTWRGFLTLSMRMWLNCIAWVSRESCRSQRHYVIIRTQEPKNLPFKKKVLEEVFSDTLSKIDFFRSARCPQICNPQLVGKLCATPSAGLQQFLKTLRVARPHPGSHEGVDTITSLSGPRNQTFSTKVIEEVFFGSCSVFLF